MKNIIKIIMFLVIFIFIWKYTFSILWMPKNSMGYSIEEPNNSIDVVYIGSSNVFAYFNTTLAYNSYGFTTSLWATGIQPFYLIEPIIKESEKHQKPILYVIDIFRIVDNQYEKYSETSNRYVIDTMKFSKNRMEAISRVLNYKKVDKKEYINYYFSFLKYHNVWKNIEMENFIGTTNLYKGYLFSDETSKVVALNEYVWSEEEKNKLPQENINILLDLIEYIKSNNLNVIFVIPKRILKEADEQAKLNDAIRIIQENNLKVINFSNLKDKDFFDYKKDFYNVAHINVYGATKYTLYFSKYLKENYNLPDHRGDKKYASWESEYERFKQDFAKLMNKNFDDLLTEYEK